MKNVLITGGAGYKGILLTKKLLDRGHKVTVIDNFMYGYSPILSLVKNPNLTVRHLDIRNLKETDVKDADVIYHLAGVSGMPACAANPNSAETINVLATKALIDFTSKDQLFIYASTTSIYGDNSDVICDETVPIVPPSLYAKTKYRAEQIVMERENTISLRFATIFGVSPKMRVDLIVNDFAYKAVNDRSIVLFGSNSKRTCMHVDDAVDAYLFSLDNANVMKNNVYNAGDESLNFSKLDIANAIKNHVKCEIINSTLPDFDIRDFSVSFKKIKSLGYSTKLTMDDGIKELLKLYSFYKVYSPYNII